MPEEICLAWNAARPERQLQPEVIHHHREWLHRAMHDLARDGFAVVHMLRTAEELAAASVVRVPLPANRAHDHGPFDIIGDIHGCADELETLLALLGWARDDHGTWRHAGGRRLIFVGDLVDRGPRTPDVLRDAMAMYAAGVAMAVPGNHDDKLRRKLLGREVTIANGLRESLEQLAQEPPEFSEEVASFLGSLPSHLVLDGGALVVAHAGMKMPLQGRESRRVHDFALYGETTGQLDAHGLPVRLDWAASYRGTAHVVYGHTPVTTPAWINRTLNIDTGCVFGGRLTALRWPEQELVSVPALREYAHPARPFLEPQATGAP
jgi:protein phosphatase